MIQKLGMVIVRPGLVHSFAVDQNLAEVGEARAQVHVIRLIGLVAAAVRARQVHHLLHHHAVEDHPAAAGGIVVAVGAVGNPEPVALPDGYQLFVVVVVAGEQVKNLADAQNGVVVSDDQPLPAKQNDRYSLRVKVT